MNEEKIKFFLKVIFTHLNSSGNQSVTLHWGARSYDGEVFTKQPEELGRIVTIDTSILQDSSRDTNIGDVWDIFGYPVHGSRRRCTHLLSPTTETFILWKSVERTPAHEEE